MCGRPKGWHGDLETENNATGFKYALHGGRRSGVAHAIWNCWDERERPPKQYRVTGSGGLILGCNWPPGRDVPKTTGPTLACAKLARSRTRNLKRLRSRDFAVTSAIRGLGCDVAEWKPRTVWRR